MAQIIWQQATRFKTIFLCSHPIFSHNIQSGTHWEHLLLGAAGHWLHWLLFAEGNIIHLATYLRGKGWDLRNKIVHSTNIVNKNESG